MGCSRVTSCDMTQRVRNGVATPSTLYVQAHGAGLLGPYGISQAAEITDVESLTMTY